MSSVALLFIFVLGAVIVRLYWRMKDAEERLASFAERLNAVETLTRKASTITAPITEPVVPPAPVAMSAAPSAVAVPPPLPTTKRPSPPSPIIAAPERPLPPIPPSVVPAKPLLPALNLEAFMGVKLFAWLGGLALFLGVVFFVRYSFEHNLITPAMRLALGAITGSGLILGGLLIPRPKFAVTAQTLCATGIVVLYGVTFASYSLYHFVGLPAAFAIMAAITGGAFLLAVKMNAQVVAILGLLGGFLTPLLLSTGEDNAAGLFTYLAVLDLGLIAVALRQSWPHLVALAAAATALMQWAWIGQFFIPQNVSTGAAIFLGFEALFLFPFWRRNSDETGERWTMMGAGIAAASALLFSALFDAWREAVDCPGDRAARRYRPRRLAAPPRRAAERAAVWRRCRIPHLERLECPLPQRRAAVLGARLLPRFRRVAHCAAHHLATSSPYRGEIALGTHLPGACAGAHALASLPRWLFAGALGRSAGCGSRGARAGRAHRFAARRRRRACAHTARRGGLVGSNAGRESGTQRHSGDHCRIRRAFLRRERLPPAPFGEKRPHRKRRGFRE